MIYYCGDSSELRTNPDYFLVTNPELTNGDLLVQFDFHSYEVFIVLTTTGAVKFLDHQGLIISGVRKPSFRVYIKEQ